MNDPRCEMGIIRSTSRERPIDADGLIACEGHTLPREGFMDFEFHYAPTPDDLLMICAADALDRRLRLMREGHFG